LAINHFALVREVVGKEQWPIRLQVIRFSALNEFPGKRIMTSDDLAERLMNLAVRVGKVVDALPDTRLGRHIAGQLVRCGTSPPPDYEEACAAESRKDFIHKLAIVLKELRETRCWLRLIVKTELLPSRRLHSIIDEADQLRKIVGQSLNTAKPNQEPSRRVKRPRKPMTDC
jgi:four helix bundle protein